MPKTQLTTDSEFLVKEEKLLNYILAALFFALFSYGLVGIIVNHFKGDYARFLFLLAILPVILFVKKARSQRVYIRVNKKGIYQDEKLITNWPGFLNAYIDQRKTKLVTVQDNFMLVVEYKKDDSEKGFRKKIPLTNTQNKSEEDVLAAVKFFWKISKPG